MYKKRSKFILIITVSLFLLMGNSGPPNATCIDKQLGEQCTTVHKFMGCVGYSGNCMHSETSGFHDDPNTEHDESLICMSKFRQATSP